METRHTTRSATRYLKWAALAVLLVMLYVSANWMSSVPTDERKRVKFESALPPSKLDTLDMKNASMAPGRVVELHTSRGEIDFVLFEQDCPKTTSRIADLVSKGCYKDVKFTRVEPTGLIQVDPAKKAVPAMRRELLEGLCNTKGAVGMARTDDPNSATSVFYILMEPWRHLDYEYTVFGRVIKGLDVAAKIRKNDAILSANLRPLTPEDEKLLTKALEIEAERNTQ